MSFRLIKFFNKDTEEWQTVAVCEDKGEKGDKGDPFRFEDFTPDQLKVLKGTVFTPYQDEEGRLNWENDGGLENPLPMDFTGPQGEPFEYEDFTKEQLEGLRGPQGIQGERGYHFTPSIDENCNLSWTNNGGLENPETVNVRGEKGDTGERGYHFTPSIDENCNLSWTNNGGLENPETVNVRGYHFTPSIDENCNLSWTNNGGLENPEEVTLRGVVQSNEEPDNHSVLWVVEEEDSGNVGKDIVTSNSVNRIEIVDEYPETLEENVLYIKVK